MNLRAMKQFVDIGGIYSVFKKEGNKVNAHFTA